MRLVHINPDYDPWQIKFSSLSSCFIGIPRSGSIVLPEYLVKVLVCPLLMERPVLPVPVTLDLRTISLTDLSCFPDWTALT